METRDLSLSKPQENEEFWKQHYNSLKSSRLSRTSYCRQHGLNYDRFGYWISRWNKENEGRLVSVKLKTEIKSESQAILCTLELKNGHHLKIHDLNVLSIILDKC
jgi:hypothetical protein